MSSPSLRPLINTCQKCLTSPANHEPRSPANGGFQNPGVCPQAVPSFLSPTPTVLFLALAPFSAQEKYRKPRSSVFLCSQTLRKRLLRRLGGGGGGGLEPPQNFGRPRCFGQQEKFGQRQLFKMFSSCFLNR